MLLMVFAELLPLVHARALKIVFLMDALDKYAALLLKKDWQQHANGKIAMMKPYMDSPAAVLNKAANGHKFLSSQNKYFTHGRILPTRKVQGSERNTRS